MNIHHFRIIAVVIAFMMAGCATTEDEVYFEYS